MKKAVSWFNKLAGWLKTLLIIAGVGILIFLCFMIYKIVKNAMNSVNGLMGSIGLGDRDATSKAQEDTTKMEWTGKLAQQQPSDITLSSNQLKQIADDIYDSFHWYSFNFDRAFAALKKCNNKVDVSALVLTFASEHDTDLLSYFSPSYMAFFTHGFRLTDEEFLMISNFVNSLPND